MNEQLSLDQYRALAQLRAFIADPAERAWALSGPAGTGKTWLVGRLLREIRTRVRFHLTATTHKAASVAAALGDGESRTIHSLLGLRPQEDHQRGRMILRQHTAPKVKAGELVIIDEASMIDSALLAIIDRHAREIGFRVLYVGDAYQLPPIFEAASPVFAAVPTSHLSSIHRQASDNPIIAAATGFRQVLDGEDWPAIAAHGDAVRHVGEREFNGLLLEYFASRDYASNEDHARAIAWTNRRVRELNTLIRGRLQGPAADRWPYLPGEAFILNEALIERGEILIANEARVVVESAAPVMLTGHLGAEDFHAHRLTVRTDRGHAIIHAADNAAQLKATLDRMAWRAKQAQRQADADPRGRDFGELDRQRREAWRDFFALKELFADLRPPHASTAHKAQGLTIDHALIDVGDIGACPRADTIARLLYVAITRPRQTATLTGDLPERLYNHRQAA